MSTKNFINYHILISHSPSNLNRDDMNMQKTSTFGGTRRVRVSSQCLKRAIRKSQYYKKNVCDKCSDRTKRLGLLREKYVEKLKNKYSSFLVNAVISIISGSNGKPKKKNKGENDESKKEESKAIAAWSLAEVDKYCEILEKDEEKLKELKLEINLSEKEKNSQKGAAKKKITEKLKKLKSKYNKYIKGLLGSSLQKALQEALQNTKDIALSGRMVTSGIMTTIDAALALAHSITTHTVLGDIDWFTAVDDLTLEKGEVGSAHLDTTEFSSGVFYRYASLNLRQLRKNLGYEDNKEALNLAAHLLHMLACVVPTAKQNAFAAFNLADFAFVTFSDQPISLANAFEVPVKTEKKGGGLLIPSVNAFADYCKEIYQTYNLEEDPKAYFATRKSLLNNNFNSESEYIQKDNLSDLEKWIRNGGE